ncbi:MAG: DUF5606 domain-containing protein [Bacteroidota bacterium]
MNLEKIVSITGNSNNGIFRVVANRNNGLIVENIETGKRKFVPTRRHNFTPLNTVGIYLNNGDAIDIDKVFEKMTEQEVDNPPPEAGVANEVIKEYFMDILPNYDEERVYLRDMKRVVKWYVYLKEHGLLEEEEVTDEEETATEEVTETEEGTASEEAPETEGTATDEADKDAVQ